MEPNEYRPAVLLEVSRPEYGYAHITARAIAIGARDDDWHATYRADLTPADYAGAYDGIRIGVTSQLGSGTLTRSDHERQPYAIAYGIAPAAGGDYLTAETLARLAKAARTLELRMDRLADRFGHPATLADVVIHLGAALRCDFVRRDGRQLRAMTPQDARYWITGAIADLNAALYPEAAAA